MGSCGSHPKKPANKKTVKPKNSTKPKTTKKSNYKK